MKGLNVMMVWVCAVMGMVLPGFASTYYVSPIGNDSSDGSATAPWRTIQHAADNVGAGDSVIVRPGNYGGFVLGWDYPQNGTPSHPITFQADPGVVINKRNSKTPDGINLEGASYIRIEGFTIQNGDGSISRAGIRSVINTNAVIRGNKIDGMGTWGIFTGFSESVLIEDNETSRSISQHGIYVSNSADNPILRENKSWGNNQCGIHMNGDASQGGDGIISGAVIEGNIIHDNGIAGGSGINCDGVQNSVIRNNLLYNNHASGISLYAIDGADGSKNNIVANNTILEAADARWAINIKDGSTGNTVLNNILFNNHSWRGSININADSLVGFISDYNVVENRFSADDGNSILTLSGWQTQTGQDRDSLIATQTSVFLNVGANDYHLSATSPAIDRGTSVVDTMVATDLEGIGRPHGAGYDIGAYEYVSPPPLSWASIPGGTPSGPALAWNSSANKLQMVVRAPDNSLWTATFDFKGVFNNDWLSIPGRTPSVPAIAWNPVVQKMQMVVRAADNSLWAATFDSSGAFNHDWISVPGSTPSTPALVWNPEAQKSQIVVRAADDSLWMATFDSNGTFNHDWISPPGRTPSGPALAWNSGANKIQVVVQGPGNSIWSGTFNSSGEFDKNWVPIPGVASSSSSSPSLAWDSSSSKLCMGVRAADDSIWFSTFNSAGAFNNDWVNISGRTASSPGMAYLPSIGYMEIVVRASDNSLWRKFY